MLMMLVMARKDIKLLKDTLPAAKAYFLPSSRTAVCLPLGAEVKIEII
jgi:hypothetical protein